MLKSKDDNMIKPHSSPSFLFCFISLLIQLQVLVVFNLQAQLKVRIFCSSLALDFIYCRFQLFMSYDVWYCILCS